MRDTLCRSDSFTAVRPMLAGRSPGMTEEGIVLGDGSILVRMLKDECGEAALALEADRDRFQALMSVVGGRPIPFDAFRHVEAASHHWRRGDKVLANLRLILADLPSVDTRAEAARLTLAEHLLDSGMPAVDLMKELGFSVPSGDLEKYSENQTRVPAGHGRESGRFGSGGGSGATTSPAGNGPSSAFVAPVVSADADAAVAQSILRLVGRLAGPLAFIAGIVVPTPNSGGVDEGLIPGMPDVRFRKDGPAGTLKLITTAPNGGDIVVYAENQHGVYVNLRTRQPLGYNYGTSIALDKPAIRAALDTELALIDRKKPERGPETKTDEPEVCPAPEQNRGHGSKKRALDYEEDVHERVNPVKPLGRREAVRVWSPLSGKYIYVDDCYRYHGDLVDRDMKPGDLAEAKGPGYEHAFAQVYGGDAMKKLVYDTSRQLSAADFRGVRLKMYFAEKGAADFVRERFSHDPQLNRVVISHMPPRKGH